MRKRVRSFRLGANFSGNVLATKETRKKFFDSMEDKQMGGVTFRLLLAWTIEHSKGKIFAQKAEDKQMGGVTFRLLLAWTIEHSKGKILAQKADHWGRPLGRSPRSKCPLSKRRPFISYMHERRLLCV